MKIFFCLLCLLFVGGIGYAQDQPPAAPAQDPDTQQTPPPAPSRTISAPREVPSQVNNGGGFSVEPLYWVPVGHPQILRGKADTQVDPGNFTHPGAPKSSPGLRISFPLYNGTLRVSYLQTKSSGSTTAPSNLNLFGVQVTKDDPIAADYTFSNWKVSYDYLTYFWRRNTSEVRLKTLWEFQRISLVNSLLDLTPVGDGSFQPNQIDGTTSVTMPTLGLGLEQTIGRHLRWEIKGSGMGLPHKSDIVDGEAAIALRYNHFEILGGGRYLHWKSSPNKVHYNSGDIYGPFVSIRYYWKRQ